MLALVPVVALLVIAGKVDVDAIVAAEGRAGEMIVGSALNPEPTAAGVITPTGELWFENHLLQLRLAYSPRFYWAKSETVPSTGRPLILHTVTLGAKLRESRRVSTSGLATVSAGAADYAYLPQVLGTTQASIPQAVNFLSVSAGAGIQVRTAANWSFQTTVEGIHRRPIGDTATSTQSIDSSNGLAPAFPRETYFFFLPSLTGRLSPLDDVILSSAVTYQMTSASLFLGPNLNSAAGPIEILTVAPSLGWRTRLSHRYDLHLAAGMAYDHVIESPSSDRPFPVAPTGAADLTVHLVSRQEITVQAVSGVLVDYYVDPILGTSGPRGAAFCRMLLTFPRSWTVGLEAAFATSLSTQQLSGYMAGFYPDETVAAVSLPVRHRVSQHVMAETGFRWSERAPRFSAPGFRFHEQQEWLYLLLAVTTRPIPSYRTP
jgi:hypothetical protein